MRLALLSDVTLDFLARMLEGAHRVWTPSGFGAWLETALEPPRALRDFAPEQIWILLASSASAARWDDITSARAALAAALPGVPVIVPDLARLASDLGAAFFDARWEALAGMPWSLAGLRELRNLFGVKKVLAVDLDDTLWHGAVSEDGVDGLVHDLAFQRALLDLKRRGVLLVALSRNDPADVASVFSSATNPPLLARDDFAALAVGWEPKPKALAAVAARIGIGLDAFVFVDDSAANRAEMRAAQPDVAVADFPPQLDVFFPAGGLVTDEDRRRTEFYRAEAARQTLTLDGYLANLDLRVEVAPMAEGDVSRVAQLSQRTNQFNACANRLTDAEVRAEAATEARRFFVARARDRLGDFGLVAFVRVTCADSRAEILDWAMSCRAMNRRIEFEVERQVEAALRARGVRRLAATWRRSGRNAPCETFFARAGFAVRSQTADCTRYEKVL